MKMEAKNKKVCIIGGGPAGLHALACLLDSFPNWSSVIYERGHDIGGVWRFNSAKGTEEEGSRREPYPSPMYEDLILNTPKPLCQFVGHPWPDHVPTFPSRKDAKDYLDGYADKHKLMDHIKLNHEVLSVTPQDPQNREHTKWVVITKDTQAGHGDGGAETEVFDYVFLCTGREMVPKTPKIANLEHFQGSIHYGIDYVNAKPYHNKKVVIVGGGISGLEFMVRIVAVAEKLILSTKPPPFETGYPEGVQVVAPLASIQDDGSLLLDDGTVVKDIDCLLLCTGYKFDHPFLTSECGIRYDPKTNIIRPLFRHVINTRFPSMCFFALTAPTPRFYLMSVQVHWVLAILKGDVQLPSEKEMNEDIEQDFQDGGLLPDHHVFELQWNYYKRLAEESGEEGTRLLIPLVETLRGLYSQLLPRIFADSNNFRKDVYRQVVGEGEDGEEKFDIEIYVDNNN